MSYSQWIDFSDWTAVLLCASPMIPPKGRITAPLSCLPTDATRFDRVEFVSDALLKSDRSHQSLHGS